MASSHLESPCDSDHWGYAAWLEHHKSALSRAIHSLHVLAKQWPEDRDEILGAAGPLTEQRDRIEHEIEHMRCDVDE